MISPCCLHLSKPVAPGWQICLRCGEPFETKKSMTTKNQSTPPAAGQAAHNKQAAFLLGISEAHHAFGMTYDGDSQSPRSRAYDYGRNVGEALADLSDAQLPVEWRAFIVRACNRHAALVAALSAFRSAAINTPALDSSPEWTALIEQANAALPTD